VGIGNRLIASVAFATALVAGTALVSTSASATILFDSLSATPSGNADPLIYIDPHTGLTSASLYASFSTDAGTYSQFQVQLLLQGTPDPGGVLVSLLSSISPGPTPTPGSVLTTIGTISDTQLTSGLGTLSLTTSYTLAANTRYWVQLSNLNDTNTTASWSWTSDNTGVGVSGEYRDNPPFGGVTGNDLPYQMQVNATPLPTSWIMMLTGLAGFGLLAAYRRRKNGSAALAAA
jgi:hypothetical protein